ncbi:MAG: tetratricopeptide repeat protein [Myxococcales bacterium]|nr:tetratricopeptide repeat protein [Myxococcales bacterium]
MAATSDREGQTALREALQRHDDVAWQPLARWIRSWPDPPEEREALRSWLLDAERLGLAAYALDRLTLGEASHEVSASLHDVLERFGSIVSARADQCLLAGDAEVRARALGIDAVPWTWIRGGTAGTFLRETGPGLSELARLWTESRLHSADAVILAAELASSNDLRAALRSTIDEITRELFVTRWTPAWSLDVARSESDLGEVPDLLRVLLPHVPGTLRVQQHVAGTWWTYPRGATELVPFEVREHVWRDDVLGDFRTSIVVYDPDVAQDVWHGLSSLRLVARGNRTSRGAEVIDALVSDLTDGGMSAALAQGHEAFETGLDLSPITETVVSHAFECRLALTDALMVLSDRGIDVTEACARLARVDEKHHDHSSAVQLVPDEVYERCTEGLPLPHDTWWGSRDRLDSLVPAGVVEGALHDLAVERAEARGLLTPFGKPTWNLANAGTPQGWVPHDPHRASALREVTRLAAASIQSHRPELPATPCAWLAPAPPAASLTPGRIPLLLRDENTGAGVVAELRVFVTDERDETKAWEGAPALRSVARDAIRSAFYAAGSCTPLRAPPTPFAMHRFELVVDLGGAAGSTQLEVDGRSIGLPAALAFASAWLDRPVDPNMAAIGAIGPAAEPRIDPVGGAVAKAQALATFAQRRDLRIIVASGNAPQLVDVGAQAVAVDSLRTALESAGVSLDQLPDGDHVSIRDLTRRLGELSDDVRDGHLHRNGAGTWCELGDELRRLIALLADKAPAHDLDEARCWAALAYSHDGMLSDVQDVLRGVSRPTSLGAELRTLYDIVQLGLCIDREALNEPVGAEALANLATDLRDLRQSAMPEMLGRAAGTLGRAYTHLRRLAEALPLLEEAVRHHASHAHLRHETARSRQYLAAALRMAGNPGAALDQLVAGQHELETWTRQYSTEYEAACRVFHDYETARVMVALERYQDAFIHGARALRACEWQFWPQLGIRRTLAWALRLSGRDDEADAQVEAMRQIPVPPGTESFVARLLSEAEGYPFDDGEVY